MSQLIDFLQVVESCISTHTNKPASTVSTTHEATKDKPKDAQTEEIINALESGFQEAVAYSKACDDLTEALARLNSLVQANMSEFKKIQQNTIITRCKEVQAEYAKRLSEKEEAAKGLKSGDAHAKVEKEIAQLRDEKNAKIVGLVNKIEDGLTNGLSLESDPLFVLSKLWALEGALGKHHGRFIYDSALEGLGHKELFAKVKNHENVAVMGVTPSGDVFGGFVATPIKKQNSSTFDKEMVTFSFVAHGKDTPEGQPIIKHATGNCDFVYFGKEKAFSFVQFWLGGEGLVLGGEEAYHSFYNPSYVSSPTTARGPDAKTDSPYHHCTRLVAIQLS